MKRLLVALALAWLVGLAAPPSLFAQTAPPFAATVTSRANLRAGPGTNYDIVGGAYAGQTVQVAECDTDCTWYKLDNGNWIVAYLVEPAPSALPTATPTEAATHPYTMPDASTLTTATVASITDGDTIRVIVAGMEYPLRYIGIDTPEVGQPYAAEATAFNRALVTGKTVYLEKDVSETDRYDRLLRYVWLGDGTLVNHEMVRLGYAQAATYPPDVKHATLLAEAQRQAMAAGVGLWAEGVPATPTPAATATPIPAVSGPTANRSANLREGPGTSYAVVGSVSAGQRLEIVGRTSAADWYQLASGAWIAGFLVNNAPGGLPVTASPIAPTPTAVPVDSGSRSGVVVEPVPTIAPAPAAPAGNCDPSYPDLCIPPAPPDLNCKDIVYRRFRVAGADPHNFDGNHDGVGCESN